MNAYQALLVTGCHRSGTTWVGKVLSEAPQLTFVPEIFNPVFHPKFSHWYYYIPASEINHPYRSFIAGKLGFQLDRSLNPLAFAYWQYGKQLAKQFIGRKPLLKDPIALMSAEWLAQVFKMKVILTIRHPAAFYGSLKRLNWRFNFQTFLDQTKLLQDHLEFFRSDIFNASKKELSLVDQSILLWRITHALIYRYQIDHPDWIFVRHEDLSLDPVKAFTQLFEYAHIKVTPEIKESIKQYSIGGAVSASNQKTHILRRDSYANIKSWQQRLTLDEVEEVKQKTSDIWPLFYSKYDW